MTSIIFLSFFLAFLSIAAPHVRATSKCHQPPAVRMEVLDEFGEESSLVFPSSQIRLTCPGDIYIRMVTEDGTNNRLYEQLVQTTSEDDVAWIPVTALLFHEIYPRHLICKCGDQQHQISHVRHRFQQAICDIQHQNQLNEMCSGSEVCIVARNRTECRKPPSNVYESFCVTQQDEDVLVGNVEYVREYKYVCQYSKQTNQSKRTECEAMMDALSNDMHNWPMTESTEPCTKEPSFHNFWVGNFILRENILINDSFTLKPKNIRSCEDGNVRCMLMFLQRRSLDIAGDCKRGWTVKQEQVARQNKTKMVCKYSNGNLKARWQFFIYNTNVTIEHRRGQKECVWPSWLGTKTTKPKNGICKISVTFPYPVGGTGQIVRTEDDLHSSSTTSTTSTTDTSFTSMENNTNITTTHTTSPSGRPTAYSLALYILAFAIAQLHKVEQLNLLNV